jgi:FkbM family methyltransferase
MERHLLSHEAQTLDLKRRLKSSLKKVATPMLGAVGLLPAAKHAWARRCEKRELRDIARLYRGFISPGDLCFDVGANLGNVSQIMLQLGARVVAIEPQDENVQVLRAKFSANPNFVMIPKAVASKVGSAEMLVCESSDCTSMSPEFVAAVTQSGRLNNGYRWNEVRQVATTTLDELMREYGVPTFTKIDVEGFEDEVIMGCSRSLKALSLEFTPERLQPALTSIEALERLGAVEFNYSVGRDHKLESKRWISGKEIAKKLREMSFVIVNGPGGDLYARFTQ